MHKHRYKVLLTPGEEKYAFQCQTCYVVCYCLKSNLNSMCLEPKRVGIFISWIDTPEKCQNKFQFLKGENP